MRNCAVNWCDKLCFLHLFMYESGFLRRPRLKQDDQPVFC